MAARNLMRPLLREASWSAGSPLPLFLLALVVSNGTPASQASDQSAVIGQWLARQTNVQTWAAEFTQTRTLKSLLQPLVSTGQVWFAAPQSFRWELGDNQTIAIRNEETMVVVYPRLKRAEKYEFSKAGSNPWKDTLALLQSGFPRSEQELKNQFSILSMAEDAGIYRLELQPKSAGARKMMPQINLFIAANDHQLAGTELVFVDGSRMRNDFRNMRTNVDVEGKFETSIPAGYKLVEPLKSR